jgi:DNA integrity scanning protein DisA with diadenylate cyclase activity
MSVTVSFCIAYFAVVVLQQIHFLIGLMILKENTVNIYSANWVEGILFGVLFLHSSKGYLTFCMFLATIAVLNSLIQCFTLKELSKTLPYMVNPVFIAVKLVVWSVFDFELLRFYWRVTKSADETLKESRKEEKQNLIQP